MSDSNDTKPETVESCACGATYTEAEWRALRFVGYTYNPADDEHPDELVVEMRDCHCGSTLGRETAGLACVLADHERRLEVLEATS